MQLAQGFVVHVAGPFRQPVVGRGEDPEDCPGHQYVVEMRHHKIGVVVLEVRRSDGQHQPGKAADGEQNHKGHGKQHRRLKGQRALPHGADPVEYLDPGGHRDQQRGVHEEQLAHQRNAHHEHVVRPHDKRQERNARRGVDH
jgi:hypothetical protein